MIRFEKMHGLGNDYLYVYGTPPDNAPLLSRRLSDRHFGAGADGMIWITPPTDPQANFGMRIFNADGSEALMCGNGIRCVGKYVFEHGHTDQYSLVIETKAGLRSLTLHPDPAARTKISTVTVEMGAAFVGEALSLSVGAQIHAVIPVTVGNPHAVLFADDAEHFPTELLGAVSAHPHFPDGVNAECAEIFSPTDIRMRVWERGSGVTMACGTGACAVCAAAVHNGYTPHDTPITVHLDGGTLTVTVRGDGKIMMTGPAVSVYEGIVPRIP